jgi:hypothetical protein
MSGSRGKDGGSPFGQRLSKLFESQEGIVLAFAILAFLSFSFLPPAFATAGNLLALIRIVSILVARQGRIVEEMTIDEAAEEKIAYAAVR